MKYLVFILLSNLAVAENRTSLFKKEEVQIKEEKPISSKTKTSTHSPEKTQLLNQNSNLPGEYLIKSKSISIEESPIVLPTNKIGIKYKNIKSGDLINAIILESVFAFRESKSPVRAVITSGKLKGSVLIGEASLEQNSKRILIEFKKFRDPIQKEIYQVSANGMDLNGVLGLEGKLVSNEGKYFSAELLSAAASGYADSSIDREQNAFGNQVESKSNDTLAKKALTAALSKSAENFAEKLKQAPEYSVIQGPVDIQILILDQPTLTN